MRPAYTETISTLGQEKPSLEAQQAEAVQMLREMPKHIAGKYSHIVLDRLFPELQLDARVQIALEWQEDEDEDDEFPPPQIVSNVIGEKIPHDELGDHWILPNGEQISRSTGAVYFHRPLRTKEDRANSLLFWEFGAVRRLLESNHPTVLKVRLERTEKTPTSIKTETISTLVFDPYEPEHPGVMVEVPKAFLSKSNSRVPTALHANGNTLAEKVWDAIGKLVVRINDAILSADELFHEDNYHPVIISNDLIILRTFTYEVYEVFAKEVHATTQESIWHHTQIEDTNETSAAIAQWLASLEKKDDNGNYVNGYKTAALSTVR